MANGYGGDGTAATRTVPQLLALVFGVIYLLVGLVGFLITGFDNFAAPTTPPSEEALLGFALNPLHNIAHILIGVAGIALSRTLSGARSYGWALAVIYGVLFIFGLVVAGQSTPSNFLNLNGADNILHLLTAIVGVVIGVLPVNNRTTTSGRL